VAIWKLLAYTNWLLITVCTAIVVYCLILVNGATDAAGRGLESALKGACVITLLVLIGLNLLPYQWTQVITFLLGMLALVLFGYTLAR
jgi:hypothetical protein